MAAKQQAQPTPQPAAAPAVKVVESHPPEAAEPSAEVLALRAKVTDLEAALAQHQRLLDRKNEEIAGLEDRIRAQAREIGRLTSASVVAGVKEATRGLSQAEFDEARSKGVNVFVVLAAKEMWDGSKFEAGLGIDARQWPQMSLYVHHGLALAAMPEAGG